MKTGAPLTTTREPAHIAAGDYLIDDRVHNRLKFPTPRVIGRCKKVGSFVLY